MKDSLTHKIQLLMRTIDQSSSYDNIAARTDILTYYLPITSNSILEDGCRDFQSRCL